MCYRIPVKGVGLLAVLAAIALSSCDKLNLYQQLHSFPKHAWMANDTARFEIEIKDSAIYRTYLVLRHTDAYKFNNIWLNIRVQRPDTSFTTRREFILADKNRWLGSGMGDVFEHRIAFAPNADRPKPGKYIFELTPVMREDPLQHVVNVGIRLQRQEIAEQ